MNKYTESRDVVVDDISKPRAWLIDPVAHKVTLRDYEYTKLSIRDIVGLDAECFNLDNNHDNICWVSNIPTNGRYCWFFEMMGGAPYCERRYNQGLIFALGPHWDSGTISFYLRFYDRRKDEIIPYQIL